MWIKYKKMYIYIFNHNMKIITLTEIIVYIKTQQNFVSLGYSIMIQTNGKIKATKEPWVSINLASYIYI